MSFLTRWTSGQDGFILGRRGRWAWFLVLLAATVDLAVKYYLIAVFDLPSRGLVPFLTPLDLAFSHNRGISFGLFAQDSALGSAVLVTINFLVAALCLLWIGRSRSLVLTFGLAMLAGGALGNGLDRAVSGAVIDYLYFHIGEFSWYIFNLADVWIFLGAGAIFIDGFIKREAPDAPSGDDDPFSLYADEGR